MLVSRASSSPNPTRNSQFSTSTRSVSSTTSSKAVNPLTGVEDPEIKEYLLLSAADDDDEDDDIVLPVAVNGASKRREDPVLPQTAAPGGCRVVGPVGHGRAESETPASRYPVRVHRARTARRHAGHARRSPELEWPHNRQRNTHRRHAWTRRAKTPSRPSSEMHPKGLSFIRSADLFS